MILNLTYASKDPDELFSFLTCELIGSPRQWLEPNHLSLNVDKTKCLFIGTQHKISQLSIVTKIFCLNGQSIERVDS